MRVCVYTGVCVGTGAGERILLKNKTKILKAQHILPLIWLSLHEQRSSAGLRLELLPRARPTFYYSA